MVSGENGLDKTIENLKNDTGEFSKYVVDEWDKTVKMIKDGLDTTFGVGSSNNIFNQMMDYGNKLGETASTVLSTVTGVVQPTTGGGTTNSGNPTPPNPNTTQPTQGGNPTPTGSGGGGNPSPTGSGGGGNP